MKTIQMTLDEDLVKAVDRVSKELNTTRSAFTRKALREALASGIPTVIHVPMENIPTPTPGYWNINDIYRKGE